MNVLLTGATGFTGSYVLPILRERGLDVCCFVRRNSRTEGLSPYGVELAYGDLDDYASLLQAMKGRDALVNIASIGFGHAPNIVRAAVEAGVRRAVFISTTAVFTSLNAPSKKIRLAAERAIKESGLAFTILRPTMIYGSPRDRNMCRLVRFLRKSPVIIIPGHGGNLQQPVHVADVASAAVAALLSDQAIGRDYNISGKHPLTFNQVIDIVAGQLGRRVAVVRLPARPILSALRILEKVWPAPPIKAEQILRLNEDKAFDHADAARDFGYAPRSFEDGIREEIRLMTKAAGV